MFTSLTRSLTLAAGLLRPPAAPRPKPASKAAASFPGPIYAKWTAAFNDKNPDLKVDYQPSGSGAGITGIQNRTLHFAGSDAPMTAEQEKKCPAPVYHIPTVAGPVVLTYNLKEIEGKELKLNGEVLAAIYLGEIKDWDDPKIQDLNPDLELPAKPIGVVHRSDGSGTTYIFTDYLSKVSQTWADKAGKGTSVQWPLGVGGKSNSGVAGAVKNTPGAIGYVESAYALTEKLPFATQINKAGKPVKASVESVEAAASALKDIPADLKVSITNADGDNAYPIAGFTYLLVYQDLGYLKDPALAHALLKFLNFTLADGQSMTHDLGYAKLPKDLAAKVAEQVKTLKYDNQPLAK